MGFVVVTWSSVMYLLEACQYAATVTLRYESLSEEVGATNPDEEEKEGCPYCCKRLEQELLHQSHLC